MRKSPLGPSRRGRKIGRCENHLSHGLRSGCPSTPCSAVAPALVAFVLLGPVADRPDFRPAFWTTCRPRSELAIQSVRVAKGVRNRCLETSEAALRAAAI